MSPRGGPYTSPEVPRKVFVLPDLGNSEGSEGNVLARRLAEERVGRTEAIVASQDDRAGLGQGRSDPPDLDGVTAELVEAARGWTVSNAERFGGKTPELLVEWNAAKHVPGLGVRSAEPVQPAPAGEVPPSPGGAESAARQGRPGYAPGGDCRSCTKRPG